LNVTYKPYSQEDQRRMVQNRIGSIVKAENGIGFKFSQNLASGLMNLNNWRSNSSNRDGQHE